MGRAKSLSTFTESIRKDDRACEYLIILALWWEFINKGGLASNADVFADFGLSIAEERLWKQS